MDISNAEQRQIENEMIFRRINEKVGSDLDDLDAMHIEDGNFDLIRDEDLRLMFKCECSDEQCVERIPLKLSQYKTIHKQRSNFIVKPEHQIDLIEEVILKEPNFNVVTKHNTTPEPNDELKDTSVDNT